VIEVQSLTKKMPTPNGELTILDSINLSIAAGESLAILGPSGSGKSTLLALMAGLDDPTEGRVLIEGTDLASLSEEQKAQFRQEKTGFIFQSFHLIQALTAHDNVALPLRLKQIKDVEQRTQELLDHVGLSSRAHHLPRQLSGGEQQRVAIARAFAAEPEILFADEPTGNLDQNNGKQIMELLFQMNQARNTTLILVTHDTVLAEMCHRKVHLDQGCLV